MSVQVPAEVQLCAAEIPMFRSGSLTLLEPFPHEVGLKPGVLAEVFEGAVPDGNDRRRLTDGLLVAHTASDAGLAMAH